MKTSHLYPGAPAICVYITVKDSKKAIEFYKKAFGAKEVGILMMPDRKTVAHAELEIEGCLFMLADENLEWGNKSPETVGGNPVTLGLYVKDVDATHKKAVDAGAKVVTEVADMFYGDRTGQVSDPFGYKWMISTHQEDVSYPEMQKRSDQLLTMEKK